MSGHSKWATIKRKKGATDAKRGQLFSKLVKEITVAARIGGGDPSANMRLRTAIDTARGNSMPMDNITRAIKKGTGELEGESYEEITYEGYGPSGVAMLVDSMTDNKNRTVADLRNIMNKNGGSMGEAGCVGWMFSKKGLINVAKTGTSEDQLMELTLDAGCEDIKDLGDEFQLTSSPADFDNVKKALGKITITASELSMVPQNTIVLDAEAAEKMLKLIDALEEHDDVQKVHANFDIPEDILEKLA